jgi:hypothetical protein
LVFASIGLSRANRGSGGKRMAIAGVVLGIVGTLVTVVVLANVSS